MKFLSKKIKNFYYIWIKSDSKSDTISRIVLGSIFLLMSIPLFSSLLSNQCICDGKICLSHAMIVVLIFAYVVFATFITWVLSSMAYLITKYGK